MKIVFRTDAGIRMGIGHVMRCLTLADELATNGAESHFICRQHPGHLIDYISAKGHATHILPIQSETDKRLAHSTWLGSTQERDFQACAPIVNSLKPAWVVVDHYALDEEWENKILASSARIMVIDDLVDRAHRCHILLDQTFGRTAEVYRGLVPEKCTLLCGSRYALLRPEFRKIRFYSLTRRVPPKLNQILITLGGVDKTNATSEVLTALQDSQLHPNTKIVVVMGPNAPWRAKVEILAKTMQWSTSVCVGANNMAELMAESDLAIGAAGVTTWERCCLGLPTIMLVVAENQNDIAIAVEKSGAAKVIKSQSEITRQLPSLINSISKSIGSLAQMSEAASNLVNGKGVFYVARRMESGASSKRTQRNSPNGNCRSRHSTIVAQSSKCETLDVHDARDRS